MIAAISGEDIRLHNIVVGKASANATVRVNTVDHLVPVFVRREATFDEWIISFTEVIGRLPNNSERAYVTRPGWRFFEISTD